MEWMNIWLKGVLCGCLTVAMIGGTQLLLVVAVHIYQVLKDDWHCRRMWRQLDERQLDEQRRNNKE